MTTVPLEEVADWGSGGTPKRGVVEYFGSGTPWLSIADLNDGVVTEVKESLTAAGLANSSAKIVPPGTILIAMYGSIGKLGVAGREMCTSQAIAFAKPHAHLIEPRYLFHYLLAQRRALQALGRGGTQMNIGQGDLKRYPIPLPSMGEQRRIAAILDHADALHTKRRQVLTHLDALTQSIFHDMFGDPARNPQAFPVAPLGRLSLKFSDGPFGSNLKSEHYRGQGIPVIRLQNIGVGKFRGADRTFVSEAHYRALKKHDCQPGDVLIATLGDPNLRACIQPATIPLALNKADCVQMRVDPQRAVSEWACALLNMPGTLALANSLILGQTRSRISMGRLRELEIPVPPLPMQRQFAERMQALRRVYGKQEVLLECVETLFASLQSQAFKGEL